jgi:hypothetical protein
MFNGRFTTCESSPLPDSLGYALPPNQVSSKSLQPLTRWGPIGMFLPVVLSFLFPFPLEHLLLMIWLLKSIRALSLPFLQFVPYPFAKIFYRLLSSCSLLSPIVFSNTSSIGGVWASFSRTSILGSGSVCS